MSLQVQASRQRGTMPGSGQFSMRPMGTVSQRAIPYGMPMGDPGLLGVLGDIGKGLVGAIGGGVGGLLTGGPLGAIGGAVRGATSPFIGGQSAPPPPPTLPPLVSPRRFQQAPVGRPAPGIRGVLERAVPGGHTGYEPMNGMGPPKGYRLNKTSYFLRDGTFVPAGTKYVKIRRRNPLNPRALDRAMGRITSAKRASKKLSRVTIRKASSCR